MTEVSGNMLKIFSIVLLCLLIPTVASRAQDEIRFDRSELAIETESGRQEFTVEVARSDAQRSRGLMFRESMASDAGMLFVYRRDQSVTMWMENTILPLDMFFIAADGTIMRIVERTVPYSRELISSGGRVRGVLELNAGAADRFGIRTGDRVLHEVFATDGR